MRINEMEDNLNFISFLFECSNVTKISKWFHHAFAKQKGVLKSSDVSEPRPDSGPAILLELGLEF